MKKLKMKPDNISRQTDNKNSFPTSIWGSKSSSKREVHSNTNLSQETGKFVNLSYHLTELEKEQKPEVSRRKGKKKIRDRKSRHQKIIEKINETESSLFFPLMINKTDKPLVRFIWGEEKEDPNKPNK